MRQDVILIKQTRGSIRPPERPAPLVQQRPIMERRPVVLIDSVQVIAQVKAVPVVIPEPTPTPIPQPVPPPQRVIQDIAPVRAVVPPAPAAVVQAEAPPAKSVTEKAVEKQASAPPKHRKKFDFKKYGLIAGAVLVLAATAYVSIDTWLTNRAVQAATSTPNDEGAASAQEQIPANEGQDESPVQPATLGNYTVAADYPRLLTIDKINVKARVLPMSVNSDGSIQSPVNIFDAGWYTGSVKPGEVGASFIDGHASGATRQGLLGSLDKLGAGDTLTIEKGDGAVLTYKVVHTETLALEGLDMKKVLLPHGNALRALNIMTCIGEWLPEKKTFDHRLVVYTELVK